MKYVTVTIGRDPGTGLLAIDRKATKAKIQAVKQSRVRKTVIKSVAKASGPVKNSASDVSRPTGVMTRTSKR